MLVWPARSSCWISTRTCILLDATAVLRLADPPPVILPFFGVIRLETWQKNIVFLVGDLSNWIRHFYRCLSNRTAIAARATLYVGYAKDNESQGRGDNEIWL